MTQDTATAPAARPAATGRPEGAAPWWRSAVIYQIYMRSFADPNGDGVGDIAGHPVTAAVPARASASTRSGSRRSTPRRWRTRLRRRRLPRRRPAVRHPRRRPRPDRGRARPRSAGDRGHRAQPHLRPARLVPGRARRRAGHPRSAPATSSATGGAPTARAAERLASRVRRPRLDPGAGRPVVPAPVRPRAARPELGEPRGPRASSPTSWRSGSTAASTASASTSRTAWPRQEGLPDVGAAEPTSSSRQRPTTRTGTATASTRSTASGGGCRPLRRRPIVVAEAWVASPERLAAVHPPRRAAHRRSTSTTCAPRGTPRRCARSSTSAWHALGPVGAPATWVLSNHDVVRHVTRYGRAHTDGRGPHGDVTSRSTSSWAYAAPAPRRC